MSGQPVYMTSKLQTVKTKTSISLQGGEYAPTYELYCFAICGIIVSENYVGLSENLQNCRRFVAHS